MDSAKNIPYDDGNARSILEYAGRLHNRTLREIGALTIELNGASVHTKGYFGQSLEKDYFFMENNNRPEADFSKVGIELKSTPMKQISKGLVSKERLVLSIIDYMKINELGFEGSFEKKNSDLLIVFYEWKKNESFYDFKILKVVHWTFPEEDLRIIREDWDTIAKMVNEGNADKLSERLTTYLGACTKGVGHDGDLREQPFSAIPAKQRALSLKSSYVNKIYRDSTRMEYDGVFTHAVSEEADVESLLTLDKWKEKETFEEYVLRKFSRFKGKSCREIENTLDIDLNPSSKSYRSQLVLRMMGVKKKHVQEFLDADISMKTILLKPNNKPQESMSFPSFDYCKIIDQTWETSDFSEQLDKKFFFTVFRKSKEENNRDGIFLGAFFWSMPFEDLMEAKRVWTVTRDMIANGQMEHFPASTESRVSHVRPHGRKKADTRLAPDGKYYTKKCFWLNSSYIDRVVRTNLLNKQDRLIPR